jgi:hypothetical protein
MTRHLANQIRIPKQAQASYDGVAQVDIIKEQLT